MTDRIHSILNFWFGDLGCADLPSSERTNLWFGDNPDLKRTFVNQFRSEFEEAISGKLLEWEKSPRGSLALIILLDQYSRYFYRDSLEAFDNDEKAQQLSLKGIELKYDQSLTLIERVFFYMPLVHSENTEFQERSIRLFQNLVSLSMPETTQVYQLFLAYAYAHYRVIKEFGRFPQRNKILARESTQPELDFLKNA
jgi:uncharacterized protein (DUF924 family)